MAGPNDPCACTAMPNPVDSKPEETSFGCIEFCTHEASMLSDVLSKYGKLGVRLTPEFMDCANNRLVNRLIEQLKTQRCNYNLFRSIPWSTWQFMCEHIYGQ